MALAVTTPAAAAGGAHVIDDAGVETPGTCHLETWVTAYGGGRGLANVSPACTREDLPRLEIGAGLQYLRDHPDDAIAGPALKLNLIPNGRTVGLAVTGAAGWSFRRDRFETASVVMPLSWAVSYQTEVNVNVGWMYARNAQHRHDATYGAQLNHSLAEHLSLMVEVVGHNHLRTGGQAGLRWNPGGGPIDLDLLAGRYVDGASRSAVTLGVTVRH
ncbi:MAG TPA: hypothetical protein VJU34_00940 [Phenylobacterium sp.]|nr:hypothetical protein [Phenylobacterium sp.]